MVDEVGRASSAVCRSVCMLPVLSSEVVLVLETTGRLSIEATT